MSEDIDDCDALLYWGTTMAVEAVFRGKPVIHFDRGDILSYDPLAELPAFRWLACRDVPIAPLLEEIDALSTADWHRQQAAARAYVNDCFPPPDDHRLAGFLPSGSM